MKTPIFSVGVVLLSAMPLAYAEPASERNEGPCFHVNIQNDQSNTSKVHQDCDYNVSRTVQAGATNRAWTIQTGRINDNRVRQYHYDVSEYFDRMGGRPAPKVGGGR